MTETSTILGKCIIPRSVKQRSEYNCVNIMIIIFVAPEPEVMAVFKGFLQNNLPKETGQLATCNQQPWFGSMHVVSRVVLEDVLHR